MGNAVKSSNNQLEYPT